jgi:hypothetical protein
MFEEFIETGEIQRLEEMRPEATTKEEYEFIEEGQPVDADDLEWFSSLHPAQARYIREGWQKGGRWFWTPEECPTASKEGGIHYEDEKSKRNGLPFTFEHEG